jgi:hypothetical protein
MALASIGCLFRLGTDRVGPAATHKRWRGSHCNGYSSQRIDRLTAT